MGKKIFVLDTNIVLHDSRCLFSFEENDIAIPIQCLSEIDKFKKGSEVINFNARDFSRFIDELPSEKLFDGGASLGDDLGKIRIGLYFDYHQDVEKIFPEKTIDNWILNTAYCISKENKYEVVIFVSKDVNLRIKSKALGLKAEDYKTDAISNTKILYERARTLIVDPEIIKSIYAQKIINFDLWKKEELYENESVVLNSSVGKKDSALAIFQDRQLKLLQKGDFEAFGILPRNGEQTFLMNVLLDKSIELVTVIGKAGTGKTIISLACSLKMLKNNNSSFDAIYFTRQVVDFGRETGFLPGDQQGKISPYMQGMYDNLGVIKEISTDNSSIIQAIEREKQLHIEPLSSIRGRSLSNKIFIIDETQNLTPAEVKTIITRAGKGTKMILIGDPYQIDLPYLDERSNGLVYILSKFKGQRIYANVNLFKGERSPLAELASDIL